MSIVAVVVLDFSCCKEDSSRFMTPTFTGGLRSRLADRCVEHELSKNYVVQ